MRSRLYVVLAFALLLSACTPADADHFFLVLVLWTFGCIASVGSLTGAAFALIAALQRKPRGFINVGIALPCAAAAVALDVVTVVNAASASWRIYRDDYLSLMMTATPVCWLATAVACAIARPPALPPPPFDAYGNPIAPWQRPYVAYTPVADPAYRTPPVVLTLAIMVPLLLTAVYYVGMYLLLPDAPSPTHV